ncbi:MAG: magnesium-translocating P-type ATPase [Candidatus Bathyarchaeota archaeon]|nr:magnesium-translocating P-type ATPase [Candidatus Bathyarchaeota archaeon]
MLNENKGKHNKKLENCNNSASALGTEELLNIPINDVLSKLKTTTTGLTSKEADKRLELYGRNEIARKKKRAAIFNFLSRLKSPLVIILMIAGGVSAALGSYASTIVIYIMVFLSVSLAYYQENNASKAAELLREKVATSATVLRDNKKQEIKLHDIVPGDIIYLSAGDITPADARVIEAKDLFVNQSSLTGESFPVEKTPNPIKAKGSSIAEWTNYLFMGTSIVSGTATAVVVKTGSLTEYGKIALKLVEKAPETEFEAGIKKFGFLIMQVTFLLVIFVFMIQSLLHPDANGILQALLFAVALAVGLTPELLPMIITINLSKGAQAMSKKGVIVKRLSSIETFGSMNVLCTDKTGTLTENQIKLIFHIDMNGKDDQKVLLYSYLNSRLQTGLKSPLDEAILKHEELDIALFSKIDEVPFDFVRRRVSVVVEKERQRFFIAKGAPEEIFKVCSYYELDDVISDLSEETRKRIEQKYLDLSAEGLRVLGVAYKKLKEEKATCSVNDENDMVFLGFVAFLDPPKETAKQSIELLNKAGVELKILTGDNELVTRKVCSELAFEVKAVVLGSEITKMSDEALSAVVEEANVFARVTPAQKDRIISLLKSNGHVVGFMGDGINDAPSLKTSDVGISVNNAVDVAKESADIILLKNDLTVLGEGVLEGRKTFGNTMKYIMMGVSSNFGNMFSAAGGSIFLPFLPMLPIQILLNNLLYDTSQTVMTTDNVDAEYIRKPKRWDISFIRRFMVTIGPVSSLFDYATFFTMIFIFGTPLGLTAAGVPIATAAQQAQFQTAWFVESLSSQTLVVLIIRTRQVPFWKSKPSKYLAAMLLFVIGFAMVVPYTPLGDFFGFEPPPPAFYLVLAGILGTYALLAEAVKRWFYKHNAQRVEQILVPKRKTVFSISRMAKLSQDIIAVVSLRSEDEFSIESFSDDLKSVINYPISEERIVQNLQYLRRSGMIKVDWQTRMVRREKSLGDYVRKNVISTEMWPSIVEDWRRISSAIESKHGRSNVEYKELLFPKQG